MTKEKAKALSQDPAKPAAGPRITQVTTSDIRRLIENDVNRPRIKLERGRGIRNPRRVPPSSVLKGAPDGAGFMGEEDPAAGARLPAPPA